MGALQKIRSQSTLLVVTIALGLICFIVPWHEVMNIVNMTKNRVFKVNGEVVKVEDFLSNIQSEQMIQEAAYGRQLNETEMAQLRENVYQSMVTNIIIGEQADKVGLMITEDALQNMIKNVPQNSYLRYIPFFVDPQTGVFSEEAFNQFLNYVNQPLVQNATARDEQMKLKDLWAYLQNKIKETALQTNYSSMLYRGLVVNNLEVEDYKSNNSPEATIAYVKVDNSYVSDSDVEVTEAEIKKLYETRNKVLFESQYPTKTISYFVKEIIPSEKDYNETLDQANSVVEQLNATNAVSGISAIVNDYSTQRSFINAFVALNDVRNPEVRSIIEKSNVGDVVGPLSAHRSYNVYKYIDKTVAPDSITIQLLPLANGAQAMSPVAVSFADSLVNVVKEGKKFDDLAKELMPEQPDAYQAQPVTEQMLAMALDNASTYFNAPVGSVHQAYMSNTLVLINVVSKSKPVEKYKIATVNLAVEPSQQTFTDIDNEINSFIAANNNDVTNFRNAALEKGYAVEDNTMLQPNMLGVSNIPGTREVIRWAFNDENSKKDITRFDLQDSRLVAVVTGSTSSGLLPVANKDINEGLKNILVNQKKSEKISELLANESSLNLNQIADKFVSKVDTAKFITYNTKSYLDFPLSVWSKYGTDKQSSPVIGTDGVFVMNTINKQEKVDDTNPDLIKQSIMANYGMGNGMFLFEIFNQKSKIEDNRLKFNF